MSNIYIYSKGSHFVKVLEIDNQARLEGLKGWLDSIELMTLLQGNGYNLIS